MEGQPRFPSAESSRGGPRRFSSCRSDRSGSFLFHQNLVMVREAAQAGRSGLTRRSSSKLSCFPFSPRRKSRLRNLRRTPLQSPLQTPLQTQINKEHLPHPNGGLRNYAVAKVETESSRQKLRGGGPCYSGELNRLNYGICVFSWGETSIMYVFAARLEVLRTWLRSPPFSGILAE